MEAILSGNESFTDYEILEEFSVYDYYGIEPVMNPKSDKKAIEVYQMLIS